MKSGIEVIEDLVTFFECSTAFMSVPTEKLRRTQGKQFNFKIISALMELRQDLTSDEKKEALKICKDIIENFRDDLNKISGGKASIFDKVDAKQVDKNNPSTVVKKVVEEEEVAEDFNMDDFLNEGGL
jgi:hypothetical protein